MPNQPYKRKRPIKEAEDALKEAKLAIEEDPSILDTKLLEDIPELLEFNQNQILRELRQLRDSVGEFGFLLICAYMCILSYFICSFHS